MVADHSPLANTAAVKLAKHGSESGRWYDQHGNLVLEVPSADGKKMIRPDLRHARKLQLAPGCTGVIKQVVAPNLIDWMIDQAILAALTLPRRDAEGEIDWLARVKEDMHAQRDKAAAEGTAVHAAIQGHIGGESIDPAYTTTVAGIMDALGRAFSDQDWRSEVSVVSLMGYATKIDCLSSDWVLDFKGKDGDQKVLDETRTYDDHAMQLAAGIAALGQKRRAAIVFFSRTNPGACSVREIEAKELERGLGCFRALLRFWQCKNNYKPSWANEAP